MTVENEEVVDLFAENDTLAHDEDREADEQEQEVANSGGEDSFQLPEKFSGKSTEEIVEAYVNLEKSYGRMGNDYGQLRKLTDEILQQKEEARAHKQTEPESYEDYNDELGFDDFVDDPRNAVDRALKANPTVQKLEKQMQEQAAEQSRKALVARHQDAEDIVTSPDFGKWVQESAGRQRMLQEAHVNYDADLASDLISMYKTGRKAATDEAVTERDARAKADFRKASVEKGASPTRTTKVFSRQQLIKLKIENPAEYERRRPEIMAAYAEGRVK